MPYVSGKFRTPAPPVMGKGPLDEALPDVKYLKPSLLWRIASHIPLAAAVLIILFLTADHLGLLPAWMRF
ncbi:MAG TPA: hypothetical protein VLE22_20875 [Bryobacteraceae bacterium]|jgi:hypothetical protein|nr:hypothetical protein [Bryobacteraceae bacterium]